MKGPLPYKFDTREKRKEGCNDFFEFEGKQVVDYWFVIVQP